MKYKRTILILTGFILLFIYVLHPVIEKKLTTHPYKDEIIRFHVRANSDLAVDQKLKLKVRDEILEQMQDKFQDVTSVEESRAVIQNNLEEIEEISEQVIAQNNKDYDVRANLLMEEFPVRKYGDRIYPQGEYETLLVTIGEGQGQNWWCVMFPPLCFVDVTHSYALDTEETEEKQMGEHIVDDTSPKLKSIVVDFFKNLFS